MRSGFLPVVVLVMLVVVGLSGCIDEPDEERFTSLAADASAESSAPSYLAWRGNVTGDAAVGWTFQGDGACAVTIAAAVSGGRHHPKASLLFDDGHGFGSLGGAASSDASYRVGEQEYRMSNATKISRIKETFHAQDGLRALFVGQGLHRSGELLDRSVVLDVLCDESVTIGGFIASREVLVRDADRRDSDLYASVSLVADVNPEEHAAMDLDAPEVAFGAYSFQVVVNEVHLVHPDGEVTFSASRAPPPFRLGGPGHYELDLRVLSGPASGFHAYLVGLYPVEHLDDVVDLPVLEVTT